MKITVELESHELRDAVAEYLQKRGLFDAGCIRFYGGPDDDPRCTAEVAVQDKRYSEPN